MICVQGHGFWTTTSALRNQEQLNSLLAFGSINVAFKCLLPLFVLYLFCRLNYGGSNPSAISPHHRGTIILLLRVEIDHVFSSLHGLYCVCPFTLATPFACFSVFTARSRQSRRLRHIHCFHGVFHRHRNGYYDHYHSSKYRSHNFCDRYNHGDSHNGYHSDCCDANDDRKWV